MSYTLSIGIPKFEIKKGEGGEKTYVLYDLHVQSPTTKWIVRRKYGEFKWLDMKMKEKKVKTKTKLPKDKIVGKHNEKFLQKRMVGLEEYLAAVCNAADILNCVPLRSWLEIDAEGRYSPGMKRSGINARAVCVVKALYKYTPRDDYELGFNEGDSFSVIEKLDNTWWKGKWLGRVGVFPVSYVELLADSTAVVNMEAMMPAAQQPATMASTASPAMSAAPVAAPVKTTVGYARAMFDFAAQGPTQISFSYGENLELTDTSNPVWWEGRNSRGECGFFPSNYVQETEADAYDDGAVGVDADDVADVADTGRRRALVKYAYSGSTPQELTLYVNQEIEFIGDLGEGWYHGADANGVEGVFPAAYVELL